VGVEHLHHKRVGEARAGQALCASPLTMLT
jgi:hypothetical protein